MQLNESMKHQRFITRTTQHQLADTVGVSRQTIISIEAGKTDPAFSIVQRIAKALSLSLDSLDAPSIPRKS